MAPHRRSSRLLTTTTRMVNKTNTCQLPQIEADDSSPNKSHSFNQVFHGPNNEGDKTPLLTKYPTHTSTTPIPQTPMTAGRIRPAPEEMHPSKSHLSTTHGPDSGLRLGFTDITAAGSNQPSGITQKTPTKKGVSECSFDFKFSRPNTQLGPEAQRMMEELQLEAQRIKAKMASEREDKKQKEGLNKVMDDGRKVAHPKSKIGRFSDAHMLEFRKMNSIADHPSVLRTQGSNSSTTKNILKRSPSKAELDDNNAVRKKLSRSDKKIDSIPKQQPSISSKRVGKKEKIGTISKKLASTPKQSNSSYKAPFMSAIPEAVIARGSAQNPTTPNLIGCRSPSKPNNNKTSGKSGLVTKVKTPSSTPISPRKTCGSKMFEHIKSNSRLPDRSQKPEHALSIFSRSPNNHKEYESRCLQSNTSTNFIDGRESPSKANKFGFTPKTIRNNTSIDQNSPSPVKPGMTQSKPLLKNGPKSSLNKTSAAKANRILFPSISKVQESSNSSAIEYPSLPDFLSSSRSSNQLTNERQLPSVPGTFTFRSDQSIKFCPSQNNFGISSGKLSIRQVSASHQPNDPSCTQLKSSKEERKPHSILQNPNKKRARAELEDELPASRTAKKSKLKGNIGPSFVTHKLRKGKENPSSIPTPSKPRGVLTLSRLNMLSRPKIRN